MTDHLDAAALARPATAQLGTVWPGDTDPGGLVVDEQLSADEHRYITAARAPNTLRGHRSDWADFTTWCHVAALEPMPAAPPTITGYLTMLAGARAKVGTMSRRLSAIKFAHRTADLPDPTDNARVIAVWEGIRRTHAAPPDQATPLMPPELWDVLDACPTTKVWKTRGRPPEPDLAGLRDRALLLIGFVAALRRSEISALDVEDIAEHPSGLVLALPRSKTNQSGAHAELVVLPRGTKPGRCPVTVLQEWLQAGAATEGPVFRPVSKGNQPPTPPTPGHRCRQRTDPAGHHPRRPRWRLQRPQPARRVRHLRPPPRRVRPGDCSPDPAPFPGLRRHVHPGPHGLGRQRRDTAGLVADPRHGHHKNSHIRCRSLGAVPGLTSRGRATLASSVGGDLALVPTIDANRGIVGVG